MILDHRGNPTSSTITQDVGPLYEAGSTSDRMGYWGLSGSGPNAGQGGLVAVRKRTRQLERNDPNVKGAVDSFVSNMVGAAITPEWQLENKEQKKELKSLWDDSQNQLDYMGYTNFYGQQELAARSMVRDGESLAVVHELPPSVKRYVPIQFQLLEADHLDPAYNDISPDGNEIRHSIEFVKGRPVKYWLYDDHPGENYLTSSCGKRTPVDRDDLFHVFRLTRAGQCRGLGFFSTVITKLHDINVYDDAEVLRKKLTTLWGGFIYQDGALDPTNLGGKPGSKVNGTQSIELKAGTFPVLRNGMKIAFNETVDVGNNYKDFMRVQFRIIARGIGITYEQLTGDLEGVNYTSLRAGLIEFRRLCETIVARTLVFQFCRPAVDRWIRCAVLNGALQTITPAQYLANVREFHRVDWHPHGWAFTDPVKDRVAELMDVRSGLDSRRKQAARRNRSVENIDQENAEDMQRAIALELAYDCYPGQTNQAGTIQKIQEKTILQSMETN